MTVSLAKQPQERFVPTSFQPTDSPVHYAELLDTGVYPARHLRIMPLGEDIPFAYWESAIWLSERTAERLNAAALALDIERMDATLRHIKELAR